MNYFRFHEIDFLRYKTHICPRSLAGVSSVLPTLNPADKRKEKDHNVGQTLLTIICATVSQKYPYLLSQVINCG